MTTCVLFGWLEAWQHASRGCDNSENLVEGVGFGLGGGTDGAALTLARLGHHMATKTGITWQRIGVNACCCR